jgi:predicted RNase H-like nuclease (RuvC/YqgF family)
MWNQATSGLARSPVPKAFDSLIERLENSDSVLFSSISLPSCPDQNDPKAPGEWVLTDDSLTDKRHVIEVLHSQIRELERQNQEKDIEIASLRKRLQRSQTPGAAPGRSDNFKQEYEALKYQYDRLREVMAVNGTKARNNGVKSPQLRRTRFS